MPGPVIGEKTYLISPQVRAYVHSIIWMEHYSMRMTVGIHSTVPQLIYIYIGSQWKSFVVILFVGKNYVSKKVHNNRGGL